METLLPTPMTARVYVNLPEGASYIYSYILYKLTSYCIYSYHPSYIYSYIWTMYLCPFLFFKMSKAQKLDEQIQKRKFHGHQGRGRMALHRPVPGGSSHQAGVNRGRVGGDDATLW